MDCDDRHHHSIAGRSSPSKLTTSSPKAQVEVDSVHDDGDGGGGGPQKKNMSHLTRKQQQHQLNGKTRKQRSMFSDGFVERHDLEQYFWTEDTVEQLRGSLTLSHPVEGSVCCLTTPSLAHAFYQSDRVEPLLDIDTRFSYLPGFRYFDIGNTQTWGSHEQGDDDDPATTTTTEESSGGSSHGFKVVVVDPPFFYLSIESIYRAVLHVAGGDVRTKILIGFLVREERELLRVFRPFKLQRTKFQLEYATVKPNKWRNYALYSNVDLPGIRRFQPRR